MNELQSVLGILTPVLTLLARLGVDIANNAKLNKDEKRQLLKLIATKVQATADKVAAKVI